MTTAQNDQVNQDNQLDPTSKLVIEEAQRRGIVVEILSPRAEFYRLCFQGRAIVCRESLSEMTTAVAASRCDDKRVTSRILKGAGLCTPVQIEAGTPERNRAFLREFGVVVVKPARGEQGRGVSVGISNEADLSAAIERAAADGGVALIEEAVNGDELRIVVIGDRVAAAAVRRPPAVTGDGTQTVAELIAAHSERRAAQTAGHSRIPVDAETQRCVAHSGYRLHDVLPMGKTIKVRGAANLHMGGTMHDVTHELCPSLAVAARLAARALEVPVVGLDLMVSSVRDKGEYFIIEANERPGLANHEPQPTAAHFVDLLFPETSSAHAFHSAFYRRSVRAQDRYGDRGPARRAG